MPHEILIKQISEQIILEEFLPIGRNIWVLVTTNSFPPVLPVSDYQRLVSYNLLFEQGFSAFVY